MSVYEEVEAGMEMDRLVCGAVGIEPRICWEALSKDEKASACSFETKQQGEAWFERMRGNFPEWAAGFHLGTWRIYPSVSGRIEAAWVVVEKLLERFQGVRIYSRPCDPKWGCEINDSATGMLYLGYAETAPLAICKAALLACDSKQSTAVSQP